MPEEMTRQPSGLGDHQRMTVDDRSTFHCGRDLDCFTCCCRDVSIVLTPYDVLRMKRALGVDSPTFLLNYTVSPFTSEQRVPVVLLRMVPETKRCPFVTDEGCVLYASRPWACRMYPLGVAEPDHPTPTDHAFYLLVREDLCHGHGRGPTLTVREWLRDEDVETYEVMEAPFKELMLHGFWNTQEALSPATVDMYYMACYDLDRFRRFVFDTRFLEVFEIDPARVEALRASDEDLLDFAIDWLRFVVLRERSMKIKRSVIETFARTAPAVVRRASPDPRDDRSA